MIVAQYVHRLPAGHDLGAIRLRARERGALWDAKPDLHFKAFLLRAKGALGAVENAYSSLYLWRTAEALRDLVAGRAFEVVTDSFGRPAFDAQVALDARRGPARRARFALLQEVDIPRDANLADALADETARNRAAASESAAVAAVVGLDPLRWRVRRALLSEEEPPAGAGERYEVLHVSAPLLDALARP